MELPAEFERGLQAASRAGYAALTRRAFVRGLIASAAGLALGGLVGRGGPVSAGGLPLGQIQPSTPSAPLADDVLNPSARGEGELSALITPTAAFYVVTKNAGGDPQLDAGSWRMVIDGQVNSPVQLDYSTLQQLPPVQVIKTLECISNFTAKCELASFGCGLISTAVW